MRRPSATLDKSVALMEGHGGGGTDLRAQSRLLGQSAPLGDGGVDAFPVLDEDLVDPGVGKASDHTAMLALVAFSSQGHAYVNFLEVSTAFPFP